MEEYVWEPCFGNFLVGLVADSHFYLHTAVENMW